MSHIVDRIGSTFPELGQIRKKVLLENEFTESGILPENLMVRIKDGTTREQRL